jgi:hypothetical protein
MKYSWINYIGIALTSAWLTSATAYAAGDTPAVAVNVSTSGGQTTAHACTTNTPQTCSADAPLSGGAATDGGNNPTDKKTICGLVIKLAKDNHFTLTYPVTVNAQPRGNGQATTWNLTKEDCDPPKKNAEPELF